MSDIKYAIYCRKSSDESSDNQKQSIPDQIEKCMEYAEREGLTIMKKPKDFSDFQTIDDLSKEKNEPDIANNRTYKKYKDYFIIKEEKTGKIPGARKKWKNLIKYISQGKINGLLSYSPDRQARNMLEGGELIDLVDRNKLKENKEKQLTVLDLKYTNFHFEDNAAGKMMLGIWFVFSKQYSDKLGEDITRGNDSKVMSGKAIGKHKFGYFINDEKYHVPHPKYFPLMQDAFRMKLEGIPETKIREHLDANGLVREYKDGRKEYISENGLNDRLKDEFYYGIFINGTQSTDLRETNPYYKPVITETEYQILMDRHRANPITKGKSVVKDEHDQIRVFENDFIKSDDDFNFTFSLPNPKRHENKIIKAGLKGQKLYLKDIVKPHQIKYTCSNKYSKQKNMSVTGEELDNVILKALSYFKVSEEDYNKYVTYCNSKLDEIEKENSEKLSSKTLEINRIRGQRKKYIKENMSLKKDVEEAKIYQNEKDKFEKNIFVLSREIEDLDKLERNQILEIELIMDMLNQAKKFYIKASYVQKRKIIKILFLNIKINHKKRLLIQPKTGIETLFTHNWWS